MKFLVILYRWLLCLTPFALGVLGWHVAHWFGMVTGICVGCVLAITIWVVVYYQIMQLRLKRHLREVEKFSTERLRAIASDPTSCDLGFAIGELNRRGLEARPSLESLRQLLISAESNRRALGMSLLFAMYPSVWSKIAKGSSSADSSEIWRNRFAAIEGMA
jgi:hypothetical protein